MQMCLLFGTVSQVSNEAQWALVSTESSLIFHVFICSLDLVRCSQKWEEVLMRLIDVTLSQCWERGMMWNVEEKVCFHVIIYIYMILSIIWFYLNDFICNCFKLAVHYLGGYNTVSSSLVIFLCIYLIYGGTFVIQTPPIFLYIYYICQEILWFKDLLFTSTCTIYVRKFYDSKISYLLVHVLYMSGNFMIQRSPIY